MGSVSASSVTTTIPDGPIETWCVAAQTHFNGSKYQCADETRGDKVSDYQSFCCNGNIINSAHDIWKPSFWKGTNHSVNLSDMVCCGISGPQAGGLMPLPDGNTECAEGEPTPLASLAATNSDNAVPFLVTYTSASYGSDTVGDFIPTETANCFWAYKPGVATKEVTLPAPDITAPPPATTDQFGFPIETASETESSGSETAARTTILTGTASSAVPTATPSSAAIAHAGVRKGYFYFGLGLVTMSLLWS